VLRQARIVHLTGKETEPWEILYFKDYKSQFAGVEKALETAALMLGDDKSRGYCMEMICADFLAGATLPRASRNHGRSADSGGPVYRPSCAGKDSRNVATEKVQIETISRGILFAAASST
jgi:hypothetical protein